MKKLDLVGLLVLVAAALMAFAATASATTTLTSPKGTAYFGTLHAQTEPEKPAKLIPASLAPIECTSTAQGTVEANGTPASIGAGSLTFTPCLNSWHVTAASAGTLTINSAGTITSTGVTVESTRFGAVCRYATNGTNIGVLTGTGTTGATATMHIEGVIPFHGGSGLCGSEPTKWEGAYKVDTPDALYID